MLGQEGPRAPGQGQSVNTHTHTHVSTPNCHKVQHIDPKPITHLAGLADGRKRSISSHLDHYLFVLGLFLCTGLRSICLTHAAVVSEYSYRFGVDFFQVKLLICN